MASKNVNNSFLAHVSVATEAPPYIGLLVWICFIWYKGTDLILFKCCQFQNNYIFCILETHSLGDHAYMTLTDSRRYTACNGTTVN